MKVSNAGNATGSLELGGVPLFRAAPPSVQRALLLVGRQTPGRSV
jgi:hypothetical protein